MTDVKRPGSAVERIRQRVDDKAARRAALKAAAEPQPAAGSESTTPAVREFASASRSQADPDQPPPGAPS